MSNKKKYLHSGFKVLIALILISCIWVLFAYVFGFIGIQVAASKGEGMFLLTTLGILCLGFSFLFQLSEKDSLRHSGRLLAYTALAIGVFALLSSLLYTPQADVLYESPFEWELAFLLNSPFDAIALVLQAWALVFLTQKANRFSGIILYFNHAVTLMASIFILAFLFHIQTRSLYLWRQGIDLHTSICFLISSLAISWKYYSEGKEGLLTGSDIGSLIARQSFVSIGILVIGITLMRIYFQRQVGINMEYTNLLLSFCLLLILLLLVWYLAIRLNAIYEKFTLAKRIQSSEELEHSNKQNKIFIEQSPTAIAMVDTKMRYLAASKKWISDYHIEVEDIIGKSHYEIFPEIGEDWKKIHRACLKGAVNTCEEAPFKRADGTMQWISWDVRPWYTADDKIGGLLMFTSEISNLKQQDVEKRRIEEILERSNEVARIGTWEVDLIKGTVKWSKVTKEIHEVDADFVPELSKAIHFFKPGKSKDTVEQAVRKAIHEGIPYDLEVELITAKGNEIWIRAIGQVEMQDGKCIRMFGVFHDIHNKKLSEEALNKANEELMAIFNAGYVTIIRTDTDGLINFFNKGAEMQLQYKANEMVGKQTPALFHLESEVVARGNELSAQEGRKIHGFDVFVEFAKQGKYEAREWTYVRKDGSTFPVQLVVTAIKNNLNEITGFLGVATDISVIKAVQEELKMLLELSTDQNNRLKNFAHIVSHNLRSHSGNLSMLLNLYFSEHPELKNNELLVHLNAASESLNETISHLNDVVMMNNSIEQNMVPIQIHAAVDSAIEKLDFIQPDVKVQIENKTDKLHTVYAIPAYLESILYNFISNGIKYRSPERDCYIQIRSSLKDSYIVIAIEDNGIGIDLNKHGDKLFGMYKTFNGNQDARGIGLFITKNQIEALKGRVEVESKLNFGTTFSIYLKNEKN